MPRFDSNGGEKMVEVFCSGTGCKPMKTGFFTVIHSARISELINCIIFRPLDDKTCATETRSSKLTSIQYPVCSGPKQFNAYLRGKYHGQ